MDELQIVRELGSDTALPTIGDLAHARGRLAVAMTQDRTENAPVHPLVRRSRPRWRLMVAGLATAGMAAALAAVVVLAPDQIGGEVPAAHAAQILHNASAAALKQPDVGPRPNQFVYAKASIKEQNRNPSNTLRETWRSVDGTRDGLIQETPAMNVDKMPLPGCRDGRAAEVKGGKVMPGRFVQCSPEPAYLPDLPADADAMLAYLEKNKGESKYSGAATAYTRAEQVSNLIRLHYLRPRSQAALFDAAAKIPGLSVVEDVEDAAGRPAVGIAWPAPTAPGAKKQTAMLLFDPDTYAFLGMREGTYSWATLTVTIVDQLGQRP